jgi:hypothetical protein
MLQWKHAILRLMSNNRRPQRQEASEPAIFQKIGNKGSIATLSPDGHGSTYIFTRKPNIHNPEVCVCYNGNRPFRFSGSCQEIGGLNGRKHLRPAICRRLQDLDSTSTATAVYRIAIVAMLMTKISNTGNAATLTPDGHGVFGLSQK